MRTVRPWSILIVIAVILSLLLVACERPLPGDESAAPPATLTPAEPGPATGAYPGGEADGLEAYPADEAYPGDEEEVAGEAEAAGDEAGAAYPAEEAAQTAVGTPAEGETAVEGDVPAAAETPADSEAPAEGDTPAEGETPAASEMPTEEAATGDATPAPEEAVEPGQRTHTVAAGENLFRIGLQYGISWIEIAEANNLGSAESLQVGQVLIIPEAAETPPTETEAEEAPAAETETQEAPPTETEATEAEGEGEATGEEANTEAESQTTYIVQAGDNLFRIALQFGLSVDELVQANGLGNADQIFVGQELIIPAAATPEAAGAEIMHEVQAGETIFSVGYQYGISWVDVMEANDLQAPYTLEPGQMLRIPAAD